MKKNLPISQKKKFKYSITFQSFDEESLEAGDSFDSGYEIIDATDFIGDILYKAYFTYGIYMPVAFGTWESTNPLENTDYWEKGIKKYFAIHISNEDETKISKEESDFITFLLSDGHYELNKFREYAVGGVVLGSIALGIGALITYFYFKGKKGGKSKKELVGKTSKSVTYKINGKDRKFPIKDAWKKEHTLENQSEDYEVPQAERFEMGGDASEHYHEIEYGEGGIARAKEVIMNKIGFNEENANYLVSQSEKFSIWLADAILKKDIKVRNDLEESVGRPRTFDKKSMLDFINKRNNHILYTHSSAIRQILDWLQHPVTPKQNLKELSFDQALEKAREWHNELQVLGGDIDFTEPETNTILKKYPVNSDGIEYYWVFIPSNYCDLESSRMGHCGRTGYGNKLISLRSVKAYGKGHTISDSHVTIAYGSDGIFYQVKGKKNNKPSEKYFPYIFDLIKSIISENDIEYSKPSMTFDKNNTLKPSKSLLEFNGFGSEYGEEEDYGFEDMKKEEIREIFDLKPTLFESAEDNYMLLDAGIITLDELKEIVEREPNTFSSFVNQMNLYEKGIITEQPSTTFEFKADCDEVRALLDISRDFNDDLVAEILCGDIGELSDGWSYYYDNPSDLVNNLNKENEQKVIDEIVRITKLDESVVKKNGIEYYLNGDDENFSPNDDFDNIIRSLASAQNQADNNDYYKYLYNAIESALNELGEVHSLNDEGVKMTIDLSNSMSLEEIAEKMDYYEFTDVEDLFSEKIGEEIDRPSLRIDDRYSPYGSSQDFNEYISDIDLEQGYKKGGVLRTKNISTNKKIKNMKSIENKFDDGGRLTHFNRHISMDSETMSEILKMTNYPLLKEYFVEKNGEIKYDRIKSELKREGVSTEMINNYLSGLFDGYNYSNTDAFKKEMAKLKLVDKEFYDKVMTLYEKISKYPKINVEYADKKAHFTWIMNNYGFVIPNREDVNYTMSDFAKDIKKTYSLDNPRNKEAYDYVNKFGDIRLFNSADMDKFERKMSEIEVEFADGGRVTTNDGIIEAFITTNKQLNVGNISTHFNEYDNQMLLRNYGTLIATRKGNDVSITNIKYSKTTTTITNKIRNIALEKRMNISYVDKFADGGETQKVNLGNGEMDLDEAIKIYEEKIKAQGRVVNARDEDVLEQLKRMKNKFAEGGMTEHGLMAGDTIRNDYSVVYPNKKSLKDIIDVTDKDGEIQFVNLDKGIRYDDGGSVDLDYADILNVLKTKIDASIDEMPMDYENASDFKGEEVEHESRSGFIPYTDGGYQAVWFEYLSGMWGAGRNLPTKVLDDEMNRQIDYNLDTAKESFVDEFPEIVEKLGLENIDYHSLYEAGYGEEAEMLSSDEMEMMSEDTIMMRVFANYYNPENSRAKDNKHTIRLFGDVNLESPYHRTGNLDDSYEFEFTFDSIDVLETEMAIGIAKIISWFNGDRYNDSDAEMKVRRMAGGGETTEFNYLYIKEVPNGLKLELTDEGINGYKEEEINDMYDLFEDIQANSEMAYIDNAGDMGFGLTEAPIITDGYYYDDMGEFTDEGVEDSKVYVWNDYMLKDLFATLMEQGSVVLTEVKSYNYGGETFTEKYIESQGGVDYYSVDYDDVNAQEFRDDIFDTLEEAKLKFDELCENGKTFEDVPLDNVQLLEVYKSGEYQTLNSKMFYDFAKGGSTDDDRPQYKKAKSWKDIENHPLVDDTSIEENDPSEGKDYWVYLKNGYCWESPNSEQHIIHEWGVKDTIREFNNSIYRCNCSQCVNEGKYKDGGETYSLSQFPIYAEYSGEVRYIRNPKRDKGRGKNKEFAVNLMRNGKIEDYEYFHFDTEKNANKWVNKLNKFQEENMTPENKKLVYDWFAENDDRISELIGNDLRELNLQDFRWYVKKQQKNNFAKGGELAKPISFTEEKKGLYYVQFSDDSNVLVDFTTPYFADQRTKKYIFQQAIHNYKRELEEERPYQVYNYDTQNVEGYFDNEIEAEEFASKFKNATIYDIRQYAGGGSVKKDKLQQARDYWKELEGQMSAKQKKFYNELLKRRQPSFEKNFNDSEIAEYINGEIIEQFGVDLGITKYQITGVNWFKLGFKYIAYREAIEEPEFWEEMNDYASGGEAGYSKKERVIDYYYQNDIFDDYETYGLSEDDLNNENKVVKSIIKYHGLNKPENVDERFEILFGEDDDEYAFGGEVEDWMEQALDSLIKETGNEDLDITMVSDNGNEFFAGNDMEEYRVFKTEKDAEQEAIEQVRDDLQESPENFNQDWLMNYIDGRDFFEEALNEMNYSYVQDIESESDKKYANRLIAEMVENGILDEDDAQSGNAEELAEYYKDDYIALLTQEKLEEGNDGLDYFINNFGEKETYKMVMDNNLIDIDEASRDAVQSDGIANFIASYDGITLYLLNNNVAYRNN